MIGALARLVFAIAAASTLLASIGVAAPPHRVEPGTPLNHNLVLGAYGYGFLTEVADDTSALSPGMAALHKALALAGIPMTDMPGMDKERSAVEEGPLFATSGLHPLQDLAITFALLVMFAPRLARPTRRQLTVLPLPHLAALQWRLALPLEPPRLLVRSTATS